MKITGYIFSVLAILFLLMDGVIKLVPPAEVLDINKKLGFSENLVMPIAIVLLVSTILYAIPKTAMFGSILLTAYLGGAIATHVRVSNPATNQGFGGDTFNIIFPIIIALFIWGGLYFRDSRLRNLIPILK
jgi:DoxX-like family